MIIRFQSKLYHSGSGGREGSGRGEGSGGGNHHPHNDHPPSALSMFLLDQFGLEAESYWLKEEGEIVEVCLKVLGGKGGFGSLLKRKGMKVKIHNFQSSRDLSGRRLRDVEAPARNQALAKQKLWEKKIIQAFGGEDPLLNQKMSSCEVIQNYQIRILSANPLEIKSENIPKNPTYFLTAAAEHAQHKIQPPSECSAAARGPPPRSQFLNDDINLILKDIDFD